MVRIFLFALGFLSLVHSSFSQQLNTVLPKDGFFIQNDSIFFLWNKDSLNSFQLEISSNSNFEIKLIDTIITSNSFRLAKKALDKERKIYWRVSSDSIHSKSNALYNFSPLNLNSIQLWLDATENSTLTLGPDNKVEEWKSKGATKHAFQASSSLQPKVFEISKLNNNNVVRFDGVDDFMQFGEINNIRSVIFLIKNNGTANITWIPVLGHRNSYDFHGGDGDGKLFGFWTNDHIKNAPARVNGVPVGLASSIELLNEYSINNFITTGTVEAEYLSKDRDFNDRSWNGDYAQIMLFSEILDSSEITLLEQFIRYKYFPPVNIGENVVVDDFCSQKSIGVQDYFISYRWSTGETTDSITISRPGIYSVIATDLFGFESFDTIQAFFPENFANFDTTSIICLEDSLHLNLTIDSNSYNILWANGTSNSFTYIKNAGKHWVKLTDSLGCSFTSDTTLILIDSFVSQMTIRPDNSDLCSGNFLHLANENTPINSYQWSTGSTDSIITVNETGQYSLEAINNNGCIANDTVSVTIIGQAPITDFNITNQCVTDSTMVNDISVPIDSSNIINWTWIFPGNDSVHTQNTKYYFSAIDTFIVKLIVETDSGCFGETQKEIIIHPKPNIAFTNGVSCSKRTTDLISLGTINKGEVTANQWRIEGNSILGDTINYLFQSHGQKPVRLISTSNFGCSDSLTKTIVVNETPQALFTYEPACFSNPISFNQEVNVESTFNWRFGDQTNSSLSNPIHTYNDEGTYNVTLIATRIDELCSDTITLPIVVSEYPIAFFTTETICETDSTTLIDLSSVGNGNITSWTWTIEENQYSDQNPTITFPEDGMIPVSLTVRSNANCESSTSKTIIIHSKPVADFNFTPTIGAPPLEISTKNESIGAESYTWHFDSTIVDSSENATHTFNNQGVSSIKLIVENEFGCLDSITKNVSVTEALYNISIQDLFYQIENEQITVGFRLTNNGNTIIDNLDLILTIGKNVELFNQLDSTLLPGEDIIYVFPSNITIDENMNDPFVCVTANVRNGLELSSVLSDNKKCDVIFNNPFSVFPAYPNPAKEIIHLDYFIPESRVIVFEIFDNMGKKVYSKSVDSEEGLNQNTISTHNLQQGIYNIMVTDGSATKTQKIIISHMND